MGNRGHRPDYVKDQAMYAKWAEYQESQEKRRKLLLDLQARREDEAKRKRKIQEEEEKKKGPKRMGVEGEWWWLEKGLKPSDMHTCFKGGVTHPIYLRRSHNSNLEYKGPMHTIGDGGGARKMRFLLRITNAKIGLSTSVIICEMFDFHVQRGPT